MFKIVHTEPVKGRRQVNNIEEGDPDEHLNGGNFSEQDIFGSIYRHCYFAKPGYPGYWLLTGRDRGHCSTAYDVPDCSL